jgi:hypothetical protein
MTQESNKLKFIVSVFFFLSLSTLIGQKKEIGKYVCYKADSSKDQNVGGVRLNQNNGYFWFDFYYPSTTILVDTIVDAKITKLERTSLTHAFAASSGKYLFFKQNKRILFKYYDNENKVYRHAQFPLSKGDTTDYVDLLTADPLTIGYLLLEGKAWYEADAFIFDGNKKSRKVYVIRVKNGEKMHHKPYSTRIFIDKIKLIPIRFDFLDEKGTLNYYYLLHFK